MSNKMGLWLKNAEIVLLTLVLGCSAGEQKVECDNGFSTGKAQYAFINYYNKEIIFVTKNGDEIRYHIPKGTTCKYMPW